MTEEEIRATAFALVDVEAGGDGKEDLVVALAGLLAAWDRRLRERGYELRLHRRLPPEFYRDGDC